MDLDELAPNAARSSSQSPNSSFVVQASQIRACGARLCPNKNFVHNRLWKGNFEVELIPRYRFSIPQF